METAMNEKEKHIDKACKNFKDICNNIENQKFEHLYTWLYKTSLTFKNENNDFVSRFYPRFEYGTIVKVDFGINVGSEVSGPHFAIVLEKYDSTRINSLTVLPLTSQNKKHNLFLGDLITDEFTKRLNNYLKEIGSDSRETLAVKNMISYYSNYAKNSFASINQITTISKNRIIVPKNKFDIIGRAKCNAKTMKAISEEIIRRYCNIKV